MYLGPAKSVWELPELGSLQGDLLEEQKRKQPLVRAKSRRTPRTFLGIPSKHTITLKTEGTVRFIRAKN